MVGLERLARRHPIAVFYGATLAFSWTLWGLMIASARGVLPFPFVTNWTGSFGPAFGAVLVTAATEGRAGVNELLRRAGRWRFGGRLWALVALGSLVPFFAGVGAYAAVRGPGGGVLDVVRALPTLVLYYPVVFVLGGPLGEEIGWRGFALPRLLERRGPAAASLAVAAGWIVWHLPLFWLEGAAQKGGSIGLFAAALAACSVAFTWVHLKSGGSLLAAIVLHTGINAPSLLVPPGAPFREDPLSWGVELGFWVLAALLALLGWARQPVPPSSQR